MSGGQFVAEMLKGYGITHVFYVPVILRDSLVKMEKCNITRIITHSEKAAAYMADGYARASHRPGICMAQSVGAANLAAGLQDAYLGLSPVIAITGVRPSLQKYRNSYQEIDHTPLFEPVCKFIALLEHGSRCHAGRCKKDLEGLQTMRILGRNMAWFLKCKGAGIKAGVSLPERGKNILTNFIR